jgi:hypothetical protein
LLQTKNYKLKTQKGAVACATAPFSFSGGKVWESNPPEKLLTPHAGFEDQREHQNPSSPRTGLLYHGHPVSCKTVSIFVTLKAVSALSIRKELMK